MKTQITFGRKDKHTGLGWYYIHYYDGDGILMSNDAGTYTNKKTTLQEIKKENKRGTVKEVR